ncbi:MAG: Lpg1974 family pore-forming outer membrane protein [Legionellaceae bacterium]|nr:Lpg1974 family pore-forming outer membrane protein [Legionellaceae bacterium]
MEIKKIIGFIVSFSAQLAFAGTMGPSCSSSSDAAPCNTSAWELGGKALYLRETYANMPWKNGQAIVNTLTGTDDKPLILEGYNWGFFVEGAYHIGNDRAFNVNFYYLDSKHKFNHPAATNGLRIAQQDNKWLAVNAEVSQVIPVSDSKGIRGYVGVQYVSILKDKTNFRSFEVPGLTSLAVIEGYNEGSFSGFGPRFGVDLTYNLPCDLVSGFSLYMNAALEVLIGGSRSRTSLITRPGTLFNGVYNRVSEVAVVPELDARTGINYKQPTKWGDFNFDVGVMWFDYVSAIAERADAESADVSFYGMFFGLKWVGNFA